MTGALLAATGRTGVAVVAVVVVIVVNDRDDDSDDGNPAADWVRTWCRKRVASRASEAVVDGVMERPGDDDDDDDDDDEPGSRCAR